MAASARSASTTAHGFADGVRTSRDVRDFASSAARIYAATWDGGVDRRSAATRCQLRGAPLRRPRTRVVARRRERHALRRHRGRPVRAACTARFERVDDSTASPRLAGDDPPTTRCGSPTAEGLVARATRRHAAPVRRRRRAPRRDDRRRARRRGRRRRPADGRSRSRSSRCAARRDELRARGVARRRRRRGLRGRPRRRVAARGDDVDRTRRARRPAVERHLRARGRRRHAARRHVRSGPRDPRRRELAHVEAAELDARINAILVDGRRDRTIGTAEGLAIDQAPRRLAQLVQPRRPARPQRARGRAAARRSHRARLLERRRGLRRRPRLARVGPRARTSGIGNVWAIAGDRRRLAVARHHHRPLSRRRACVEREGRQRRSRRVEALRGRDRRAEGRLGHRDRRDSRRRSTPAPTTVACRGSIAPRATQLGGGWINPAGLVWDGEHLLACTMDGLVSYDDHGWHAARDLPGRDTTAVVRVGRRMWVATRRGLASR